MSAQTARDSLVRLQLFMEHIGAKQMMVLCGDGSEIYGSEMMEQIATLIAQCHEDANAHKPLTEQELEPIRRRMMMEAYNAADDGDFERYNALKVMANDVLDMLLGVKDEPR